MTKKLSKTQEAKETDKGSQNEPVLSAPARNGLHLIKSSADETQRCGAHSKPAPKTQSRVVAFMQAFADAVDADVSALRRL